MNNTILKYLVLFMLAVCASPASAQSMITLSRANGVSSFNLAGVAQNTVLGSVSSGTTAPIALSATQLTTIPNLATSSLQGMMPSLTDAQIAVGKTSSSVQSVSLSGDATLSDTGALTLATVNSNVGNFTNANITVNAKGLITAAANGSGGGGVSSFTGDGTLITNSGSTGAVTVTLGTSLPSTITGSSLTSVGTISSGTWAGTTIAPLYGGLGITTTPSNGYIPIGNGTDYTAAALTAGTGITITNGSGSVTVGVSTNTDNTLAGFSSSGAFSDVAIGTGLTLSSGTLSASGGSGGISSSINCNTVVSSGTVQFPIPSQPLEQPSGIIEPLPPVGSFSVPTTNGTFFEVSLGGTYTPSGICVGPDNNLWGIGADVAQIYKLTPQGTLTTYTTGITYDTSSSICPGSDGNLWFIEYQSSNNCYISKITTSGTVTQYSCPNTIPVTGYNTICSGSDGNIWWIGNPFGTSALQLVKVITSSGAYTTYTISPSDTGYGICSGPDGNLWITGSSTNSVYKVSTAGSVLATYTVPTGSSKPAGICAAADGNLWGVESASTCKVFKLTTSGTFTEYTIDASSGAQNICAGADGYLYVPEQFSNCILRMNTAGRYVDYTGLPTSSAYPISMCTGPDGNMWGMEELGSKFFCFVLNQSTPPIKTAHIIGGSPTPTYTAGAGAGTSPTIAIEGTDLAGQVSVTTGSSPSTGSAIVTITFAVPYASAPYVITSPSNSAADVLGAGLQVYPTSTTTTLTLNSGTTGLAASTTYKWNYLVSQ